MFERGKPSGTNFNYWFCSLKLLVLRVEKKLFVIKQPISPAPPVDSTAQVLAQWNAVYDAHNKELKSMLDKQAGVERFDLIQTFHACKQEEGKSVSLYVLNLKRYMEQLEWKTIGELHVLLIEYEKCLPKKAATPQVMAIQGGKIPKANKKSLNAKGKGKGKGKGKDKGYIPKPKNPKPYAKEHPAKDDACHHYKEVGHCKRNCPVYLAELIKKKKQVGTTSSSGIFTIELFSFPNKSWVYDTGCGTHICNTKQGLRGERKLKQGAFYLCVGNGVRAQVEAIGSDDLVLPNGLVFIKELCSFILMLFSSDGIYVIDMLIFFTPHIPPQHNGVSTGGIVSLLDHGLIYDESLNTALYPFGIMLLENVAAFSIGVPTRRFDKNHMNYGWKKFLTCLTYDSRDETIGYYFYFPPENKTVVARYAEFLEKNLLSQEVSGRAEELEEIQDKDTSPSKNTSKIPMEVKGIEPPQEEVVPVHRSARTHRPPDCLCLNVEVEEHSLGDLKEPNNYKAAILDPKSDKWVDAKNAELQSVKDNQVWCLVDLPPNCKTVGSKWFFKKKTDMDDIIHTYKARLVAKGYTQTYRVDYKETFSPVTDIRAIRILIAIVAFYDYEIWKMDDKTAFLNGYLNKDIYMVQPKGFVNPNHPRKVCKLQRSINGLKQTSKS
ncbi:retrotransposon protein, putative, ty1-copia subclass [Tanacetum coccineum]